MSLTDLNPDQARESVNAAQRYAAWRDAKRRALSYRGSLTWHDVGGADYLTRSYYDASGQRRQKTEGRRSPETERVKSVWERGRDDAVARLDAITEALGRQKAINKALGLGRLPLVAARIVRAIDAAGLLGHGIRIVGTNALYAYEAAAGVRVDAGATATQDIDLLMDARKALKIVATESVNDQRLVELLKKVDRTFERTQQTCRAVNQDGYFVDLIKPSRNPPWSAERDAIGLGENLIAVQIEGLVWLENSPSFEAIVIDETGMPLKMVTVDPRVFAIHKLWLCGQAGREPIKRRRDRLQAEIAGAIVGAHLTHLTTSDEDLRMLPAAAVHASRSLFAYPPGREG